MIYSSFYVTYIFLPHIFKNLLLKSQCQAIIDHFQNWIQPSRTQHFEDLFILTKVTLKLTKVKLTQIHAPARTVHTHDHFL